MNTINDIPPAIDQELYPALIQCFLIIIAGYIAGQLNLFNNIHSIGLSRYISNFALPAIVFKNLVNVQFQSVSWQYLGSVLISKTILFILTMIITFIGERPRNFACMGQYAIITTQSNDFALILPIIDAVFKQTHPDFGRYVYLIAPISLVILNPIGFFLIEVQKRLDDQRKHREKSWNISQLIWTVFRNISCNPIVICTLLGVIFNQIFQQNLPYTIDYILTPIAQSFTSTALFYLGLTMVGKLNRLNAHLVITVCLLCLMKLIIFPLILRQVVLMLVKPIDGNWNNTIDYSNLGFLYGTAPTAPSVIFYIPETNVLLQAISSTELVVSTLLAGPIILVSAKMINLRTLDFQTRKLYEYLLTKTAFDVSIISLFATIIVLIGFCIRYRSLKISFIHRYTFIFVGLQMVFAIWTIAMHYVQYPLSSHSSLLLDIGSIFLGLSTRTWATSLSMILMIMICYSNQIACRYSWFYHIYGWILPLSVSGIIYLYSLFKPSKEISILGAEKFGKIQIILSIVLLSLCIFINIINLLRIVRRTYRLKHRKQSNFSSTERRPLMDDEEDPITTSSSIPLEQPMIRDDYQLFHHGILIVFLTIDAIICLFVLLWLLLSQQRNGIYYELQFLDTVLLHSQGMITFLIFALDAELLLPISRKIIEIFRRFGFQKSRREDRIINRSIEHLSTLDFQGQIRPNFLHRINMMNSYNENLFIEHEFCQWLILNQHVDNEFLARTYFQQLIDHGDIICVNNNPTDLNKNTYITPVNMNFARRYDLVVVFIFYCHMFFRYQSCLEPIYQTSIVKPDCKPIHCHSKKCYHCLNEYFEENLLQTFSQMFLEQKDTLDMGRPNAVVTSPNITLNDDQMTEMQDEALKQLENQRGEFRKRFALLQMDNCVFILGGYVIDRKTISKQPPKYDYCYKDQSKELIRIPPLPGNGRMSFGLAATDDDRIIGVGGHNFSYHTMTNVHILDTHAKKYQWENLPDMPNGTIGPGVSVLENILYVIGGFDFLGRDIICHGDVLIMDLKKKQWKTLTELDPPRARPLISFLDTTNPPSLIVAGGYNFNNGKSVPYGKIDEYNHKKKKWKTITEIPNFKTSNGLATKNNKLFLLENANENGQTQVINEYNLITHQWENPSHSK